MALNSQYSITARNVALAALAALCDGGKLRVYDGAQPANGDTAVTTQNLLAEFTLATPSFGTPGSGSVAAASIAPVPAVRAGTASWFRVVKSDGTTVVMDGTLGTATSNLVLNAVAITLPSQVSVTSLSLSMPSAGA